MGLLLLFGHFLKQVIDMILETIAALASIPILKRMLKNAKAKKPKVYLPRTLTASQKENALKIVNAFEIYGDGDPRKLAYILGTAYWESGLMPIKERRADPVKQPELYKLQNRYWPSGYYGRGFVQLTWPENYKRLGQALNIDLLRYPDEALNPNVSADILVAGMMQGLFTGKELNDYIPRHGKADYKNARRVVNVLDRWKEIKGLTLKFIA